MPAFTSQIGRYQLRYADWPGSSPEGIVRPPADAAIRETLDHTWESFNHCFEFTVTDTERDRVGHFSGVFSTYGGSIPPLQTLIVEDTRRLWLSFIDEVRIYDLDSFTQIGHESCMHAWRWLRTRRSVILVDETDLIAWDLQGVKRWKFSIDPPHDVTVKEGWIYVKEDCMTPSPRRPQPLKFREDIGPDPLEPWDGVLA